MCECKDRASYYYIVSVNVLFARGWKVRWALEEQGTHILTPLAELIVYYCSKAVCRCACI